MIHWKYFNYVLRHKWYVFWAGWKLAQARGGLWRLLPRLLIHDWSKCTPGEWLPYARFFYGPNKNGGDFEIAWNHHQKTNDHHWQYWVLVNDSAEPKIKALDMPEVAIMEMVADWVGAGLAITGRIEVADWYRKNYDKIILSEKTRERVDFLVSFAQGLLEEYSSDYFTKKSAPVTRRNCVPVGSSDEVVDGLAASTADAGRGSDDADPGSDSAD